MQSLTLIKEHNVKGAQWTR